MCSVFSTKLEPQSAGECHGQPSQTGIENWSEMILVCLAPFRDSGAKIPYSHSLSPSPSSPTPSCHTSSDNGGPITGLFIVLVVSHGLVTVLETINVLRTSQVNECEEATLSLSTNWPPAPDRRLAQPRPIDRTCTSSPPTCIQIFAGQAQIPFPILKQSKSHFKNKLASISILKTNPGLKFCYHRDLTYRSCVSTMSGGFLSLVTHTLSRVQRSQAPTPGYNADDSQVLY